MEQNAKNDRLKTSIGKYKDLLTKVKAMTVAIIGYGNQGRAQALNLRDSGFNVIVGNIEDHYAKKAREDGFNVYTISEVVSSSRIIFVLVPDELQEEIFKRDITPQP